MAFVNWAWGRLGSPSIRTPGPHGPTRMDNRGGLGCITAPAPDPRDCGCITCMLLPNRAFPVARGLGPASAGGRGLSPGRMARAPRTLPLAQRAQILRACCSALVLNGAGTSWCAAAAHAPDPHADPGEEIYPHGGGPRAACRWGRHTRSQKCDIAPYFPRWRATQTSSGLQLCV